MSRVIKKTTGLTGLAVSQYPHRDLGALYKKILRVLATIPENSAYRKYTEKLVKERHDILQQNSSVTTVEEKIGCGQIEELIVQASNELSLAKNMQIWKPWENLVEEPPQHQWTWPPHK
ncbi:NADH dehydrogenase (ubiquinone) subunit ND-13B [Calliopsis andreniformis]|uniref:NADH dehydrogenase (ubiquinone) subunit ND-13B n=1 Tax=Calliopsis andreniformis TaxID=337506 RepID=UPI003FCC5299